MTCPKVTRLTGWRHLVRVTWRPRIIQYFVSFTYLSKLLRFFYEVFLIQKNTENHKVKKLNSITLKTSTKQGLPKLIYSSSSPELTTANNLARIVSDIFPSLDSQLHTHAPGYWVMVYLLVCNKF